jgi:hypothetical protein
VIAAVTTASRMADRQDNRIGSAPISVAARINLARADIGAPHHLGDNRARRETLGDDRPRLLLAPTPLPLSAGDQLNSRYRTVSTTSESTVACSAAYQPDQLSQLAGGLRTV